ncbi:MAG: hypothetical protein ABEJ79_10730 [Halolamina sp.]
MTSPPTPIDDWSCIESETATPFDVGPVTVQAATTVYEDVTRRATVAEATGVDALWRFFFRSRLTLTPETGVSRALERLVTDRATAGFADRLRDRGLTDVRERESRSLSLGDAEATLTRYEAVNRLGGGDGDVDGHGDGDGGEVTVEGYVAVWPAAQSFRLAGGAYPVAVGDQFSEFCSPESDRRQLFDAIRAVGDG